MSDDRDLMGALAQELTKAPCHRQPSAWELCQLLEQRFGPRVYWVLREALEAVATGNGVTAAQREYFQWLLDSEDLSDAMRGADPPRRSIQSTIDHLIHQGKAYRTTEAFREMVDFMARFRDYSPFNNMLVRIQNPSCGYYATAKDWWSKHERWLKEDARPMLILAPMHPVMLVYDLDQTEGKEPPESLKNFATVKGKWKPDWLARLIENAGKHDRIRVQFKTLSSTHAGFAAPEVRGSQWKMRIAIHDGLDGPTQFGVLCHELAHIYLGHLGSDSDYWWPSRRDLPQAAVEVEAESAAYVVCSRLCLEGTSAEYISNFTQGSLLPNGVSLDLIAKVAGRIEDMACGVLPTRKKA